MLDFSILKSSLFVLGFFVGTLTEGTYDWGGGGATDDSACVTRGVWGHAPPETNFKISALRSLLRPYLYSNLYLDSMPLEYTGPSVFGVSLAMFRDR